MKTDEDILDEFGKLVGSDAFDSQYGNLIQVLYGEGTKFERLKPLVMLFNKFNIREKEIIREYINNLIRGTLFDFLRVFEENEQFKIVYVDNGEPVNLVEISEMLKAEIHGDDGWIARFSTALNEDEGPMHGETSR